MKKKYNVQIREIHISHFEVEVDSEDSEDQIKEAACQKFENGASLNLEFSHAMPRDTWVVEEIKEG